MEEAAKPDLGSYASFNEFFTRALRPGARPLAQADYICPVDGAISQFGAIDRDRIVQARATSTRPSRWSGASASWPRSSSMAALQPCI
jgi:phosphatidylserine decarboxylase